ncbi:MAG: glycosyltransferase family 2 protein [Ruminococcaceae bacterium]|nr:glycosyltransferase family 2 protein [Oscillospiraceae bacterium]
MSSVSVIIPVYNVENYLRQCVESVVNQTYKDIEIILVDDGSKDSSGNLCDELAGTDSRIKVIHKPNGGLADARNCGTNAATGEWILYLDSDDWYEKDNHIEILVNQAHSLASDVVCYNYRRYFDASGTYSEPLCTTDETNPSIQHLVDNKIYTSSAWSKLIKRSLITENDLYFEKGLLSEDIEFSARLLLLAEKITFNQDACLVYRARSNSITTTVSKKHVDDLVYIVDKLSKFENRTDAFNSYLAFQYCTVLINAHIAKADKAVFTKIFSYKWLLKYDSGSIVKLVHTVSRITGIRICSYVLYLYFKFVLNKL